MTFNLPPLSRADSSVAPRDPTPVAARVGSEFSLVRGGVADSAAPGTIPASPPPELAAEIDRAAQRADELQAEGRQLRFRVDDRSGRVKVEVLDHDGNVVHQLPLTEVLDVAAGKAV